MKNMHCNNCKQNVGAQVDMGVKHSLIFLILLAIFIIPGIIYLIYIYTSLKLRSCPICHGTNFDGSKTLDQKWILKLYHHSKIIE